MEPGRRSRGRDSRARVEVLIQKDLNSTCGSSSCFSSRKSLNFSDLHFPYLQNRIDRCLFMENIKSNACEICIRVTDT